MNDKKNLREKILKKAGELFRKNGFRATSNKQISKAVGCTTAALYYYFEDGKSQILREVISANLGDPSRFKEQVIDCKDLKEFLNKLKELHVQSMPRDFENLAWLILEYPRLQKQERAILQEHIIAVHDILESEIRRFVADPKDATSIAWISICAYNGFHQMLFKSGIGPIVGLDINKFGDSLIRVLSKAHEVN